MMYARLLKYYIEQQRWARLPASEVRRRQTIKFRQIFEHARVHSPFYRSLYKSAGVLNLEIRAFDDIQKVPVVDKQMMRAHTTEQIMTRPVTPELVKITTSGSTGEPFNIYQSKFEQYTSHLRVLGMLAALGYWPWHQIIILTRMESTEVLPIEQDLSLLGWTRKSLKLFRRDILSIHAPLGEIVKWIQARPHAKVFWNTPGLMMILCEYLDTNKIELDVDIDQLILTSETLSSEQRAGFGARMNGNVVSHYGMMECPTIGFDTGTDERKRIFSNACMMELLDVQERNDALQGELVMTNLVNWTMPFIRYNTHDSAIALNDPECPAKLIGPIRGRLDDVLVLSSGEGFAFQHAYAMFMDFTECIQYKFLQTAAGEIVLRLRIQKGILQSLVHSKALARWKVRYPMEPLKIEFVEIMPIDSKTGKFKVLERLREDSVS